LSLIDQINHVTWKLDLKSLYVCHLSHYKLIQENWIVNNMISLIKYFVTTLANSLRGKNERKLNVEKQHM